MFRWFRDLIAAQKVNKTLIVFESDPREPEETSGNEEAHRNGALVALEAIANVAANGAPSSPYDAVFDLTVTPTTTEASERESGAEGVMAGSIVREYASGDAGSRPGSSRERRRTSEAAENPAPRTEVDAVFGSMPKRRPLWNETEAKYQLNERQRAIVADWVQEMSTGRCSKCAMHKDRMAPGHNCVTELLKTIKDSDPRPILIDSWIEKLSKRVYGTPVMNVEQLLVKAEERMKGDVRECKCAKCKDKVAVEGEGSRGFVRPKSGNYCYQCGKDHNKKQ